MSLSRPIRANDQIDRVRHIFYLTAHIQEFCLKPIAAGWCGPFGNVCVCAGFAGLPETEESPEPENKRLNEKSHV